MTVYRLSHDGSTSDFTQFADLSNAYKKACGYFPLSAFSQSRNDKGEYVLHYITPKLPVKAMCVSDLAKATGFDDYAAYRGSSFFLLKDKTLYTADYVVANGARTFENVKKLKTFAKIDHAAINKFIAETRNQA